jgi:hypothetical protein
LCVYRLLTPVKMINELRINQQRDHIRILFSIDKQSFQQVKMTGENPTQFKRLASFTTRPLLPSRKHSKCSLCMRFGLLSEVSRTIIFVPRLEIPARIAANTGLSRRSFGFDSSPVTLGQFQYLCFPLLVSFHQYSTPLYSLITAAI